MLVLVCTGAMKFTAYDHDRAIACVLDSLIGVATFVITLTFLFSPPRLGGHSGRLPGALGGARQFILEDAVLLGVAIWSFGEALRHAAD